MLNWHTRSERTPIHFGDGVQRETISLRIEILFCREHGRQDIEQCLNDRTPVDIMLQVGPASNTYREANLISFQHTLSSTGTIITEATWDYDESEHQSPHHIFQKPEPKNIPWKVYGF